MSKKQFFIIVDTETTIEDTVADFGAIVVDLQGNIHKEIAILVYGEYGIKELFFDIKSKDEIWTLEGLKKRKANYSKMLENGSRTIGTVNAINRWLEKAKTLYNPELTAYNLAFDLGKCNNTGINLDIFDSRFCLWHMSAGHYAKTKAYRRFVLQNHAFNPPTKLGNMTYKTNAEVMAGFVSGYMLPPEPHTALEDAKFYELPILKSIMTKRDWRSKLMPYSWDKFQVRDCFTV